MGKTPGKRKGFCVVDRSWDLETVAAHTCGDGSHIHIQWADVNDLFSKGFLEPLRPTGTPRDEDESDYILGWLIPGHVIQFKRIIPIRGLTCKIGEIHAAGVVLREDWALTMLAQIRMSRESGIRQSDSGKRLAAMYAETF